MYGLQCELLQDVMLCHRDRHCSALLPGRFASQDCKERRVRTSSYAAWVSPVVLP